MRHLLIHLPASSQKRYPSKLPYIFFKISQLWYSTHCYMYNKNLKFYYKRYYMPDIVLCLNCTKISCFYTYLSLWLNCMLLKLRFLCVCDIEDQTQGLRYASESTLPLRCILRSKNFIFIQILSIVVVLCLEHNKTF